MNLGRFITGAILILGVLVLVNGLIRGMKENAPIPTQYIMHFRADINEKKDGVVVVNQDRFPWPDPVFTISNLYEYKYPGHFRAGTSAELPFANFRDREGHPFPGVAQFNDFDIRTATMAHVR